MIRSLTGDVASGYAYCARGPTWLCRFYFVPDLTSHTGALRYDQLSLARVCPATPLRFWVQ